MTFNTNILLTLVVIGSMLLSACGDPCKKLNCLNGGVCNDGDCDCEAGYEGGNCGTESRNKFLGTFMMTGDCNSGVNTYNLTVEATTEVLEVRVTNLYGSTKSIIGVINGNTFDIASQPLGIATISGTGTLSGTNLTVQYTLSGGVDDECTAVGTKQL